MVLARLFNAARIAETFVVNEHGDSLGGWTSKLGLDEGGVCTLPCGIW